MDKPQLHMTNPDGSINTNYAEGLSILLTSDSDHAKCFGRAVASGITQSVMDWTNAEMARGTEPALIMIAMVELQIQQMASIAGNFVTSAGADAVLQFYHDALNQNFAKHAAQIRTMLVTEQAG